MRIDELPTSISSVSQKLKNSLHLPEFGRLANNCHSRRGWSTARVAQTAFPPSERNCTHHPNRKQSKWRKIRLYHFITWQKHGMYHPSRKCKRCTIIAHCHHFPLVISILSRESDLGCIRIFSTNLIEAVQPRGRLWKYQGSSQQYRYFGFRKTCKSSEMRGKRNAM